MYILLVNLNIHVLQKESHVLKVLALILIN